MIKKITTLAFIFLITASSFAEQTKLEKLGSEILEEFQSFYPVNATYMGVHLYDDKLADFSDRSVKTMLNKLNNFEKRLYRYKDADLPIHDRINYQLLKSNCDMAIFDLKRVRWHKRSPQLYVDEATNGIYLLLLSQHAPLNEKADLIIRRMGAVPTLFKTAQKNIKNPHPVYIEAAVESLESTIDFYKNVGGELMNRFPDRADEILRTSTLAREAMNDFIIYLTDLTPSAKASFSIGKDNFDYMLSHQYFLDYNTDSMLAIGQALFNEVNKAYHEQEQLLADNPTKKDSVFVPNNFTRQDILNYYNWETLQTNIFILEKELLTIPDNVAPLSVIETPSFLQSMISGIAYHPAGPFDQQQKGIFYVRPLPDTLNRDQQEYYFKYSQQRGFKGSIVHEAYPGHHLQMQISGMHSDPVRKWQINNMMIEGWALYSEQMMYEQGLYGDDPARWLKTLGGIRFRAARIIADIKLHTGQFTYQECVDWMIEALNLTTDTQKEYIKKEVRRYTLTPTYQMSYLMGKREIMNLLESYKTKHGDSFKLKDFHDALLSEGSIPPALMWDILELSR